MRILITGGTGFLEQHKRRLEQHKVRLLIGRQRFAAEMLGMHLALVQ